MLRGATTWGINHRIPRMLRAAGFNYSGRAALRVTRIAPDCICRREKLKSGGDGNLNIYSNGVDGVREGRVI